MTGGDRVRWLIHDNAHLLVAVLVVVSFAGGWLTYGAYAAPGTHSVTRTTGTWTVQTSYEHSATVTRENDLYPVGTRLSNRSLYFGRIAPVLNGTFAFGYRAASGNLTVNADPSLVVRSVKRNAQGSVTDVYWTRRRSLGPNRTRVLPAGSRVVVPFSVNVTHLSNVTRQIHRQIGQDPGTVAALVRMNVSYRGTVDGRQVNGSSTYPLRIQPGQTYSVGGKARASSQHAFTRRVTVPNKPGPLRSVGGPVVFVLGLLGLVAVVVGAVTGRFETGDGERAYAEYLDDRETFAEWIHAVSLPEGAASSPRGEAASLADLVDLAIDTNNAVLDPPGDDAFYVVHDGFLYVYEPPRVGGGDTGRSDPAVDPAAAVDGGEGPDVRSPED